MSEHAKNLPAPADLSDVEPFDNSFRWWVRSRTNSKRRYLVDLSLYKNNGKCACPDFLNHFEKYLARGFTPAQVLEAGEIELRDYQLGIDDVLRCWHICRAQKKLVKCFSEKVAEANTHR